MNRILLKNNSVVTFSERPGLEFNIDKLIGKGSSCVVYHAVCSDNTEHLLKEYYPKHLEIERDTEARISATEKDKDAFEQGLRRFQGGCERQKAIRLSNENLKNFTCNVQGYYKANGTEYIDMTCFNGQTYDNVQEKSVYDLALRMRTLTQVVGNYHKAGLLHLDIKPENIYVRPTNETVEDVMLFDFDSVVAVDDVRNSKALSCTKTWAAPEQLLADKRKVICPATDLFAIGEIIFYQLIGRHSTQAERRSFVKKYEYDYEADIFKDVNPKVFVLLNELLSHTICGVVSKRYQSADELIAKLNEIIKIADPKEPYLKSSLPSVQNFFVGRDDEIEEIHEKLNENNILFLKGIGGIGKSELAKHYARAYEKDYDVIIFAPYVSDVNMLIQDDVSIPIHNFYNYPGETSEEYCVRKLRKLQELCHERTLFIVDNLDSDEDENITKLFDLQCKVVITTRMDFSDYGYGQQLNLDSIQNRKEVRSIFDKYYTKALSGKEDVCVDEIIDLIAGHTMTVELLAKQMMAGRVTPNKMLAKLKEGGISESGKEKVRMGKDGILAAQSAYAHIQTLFDLSEIEDDEKYVLANLSLIPYTGISTELFHDWCELEDYEAINRLIVEGWIRLDEEKDCISLHPVIKEVSKFLLYDNDFVINQLLSNATEVVPYSIGKSTKHIYFEIMAYLLKKNYLNDIVSDFLAIVPFYLCKFGDKQLMIKSTQKALDISKRLYGENSINVAKVLNDQGVLYKEFKMNSSAEENYLNALKIILDSGESEDMIISDLYNNLAVLYGDIGIFEKAKKYYELAIDFLNNNSADTGKELATVYCNFGLFYLELNDFVLAKKMLNKSLEMSISIFGENHSAVAWMYNNLGGLYLESGDFNIAKEYFLKALDIRMDVLGEDHIDTLLVMSNLASVRSKQGQLDEAKGLWIKCLEIGEKVSGEKNVFCAAILNDLGHLYYQMDEIDKAKEYYDKALDIFKSVYGNNNRKVSQIYSNLGNFYLKQRDFEKAEEYHSLAMKISEILYKSPHNLIAYDLFNFGVLRSKQNNVIEAKRYFMLALEMYIKIYGENHYKVKEVVEKINELE